MSDFKLAQGYEVDDISSLAEGFEIFNNNILASISANNLYKILVDMVSILPEPLFFFIEVPCDNDEEKALSSGDDISHKKVFYLDNCNQKVARAILKRYGELLINDGLVQFGFGSHSVDEEIYIKKYNVLSVFSNNIVGYSKILESKGIPKTKNLKTVWDIFSNENTGVCTLIEYNGENIYDIIENLSDAGLYFSHNAEN